MADSEEVFHLLQIVEQAAKHGDVLKPIHDHAMTTLRKIAEEHKPKPETKQEAPRASAPSGLVRRVGYGD